MSDPTAVLLRIDGQPRLFTPIRLYRLWHRLPEAFGVALFAPKDLSGLGHIDRAGGALNGARAAVLAALPRDVPASGWLAFLPLLGRVFAGSLLSVNAQVSLKRVEIDFAVAGFNGVCEAVAFALLRAQIYPLPPLSFAAIYGDWLDNSVRVAATGHAYVHEGARWTVRLVQHAYGRAGLMVERAEATDAVYDAALGCPAEGFMAGLLADVGARMLSGTTP